MAKKHPGKKLIPGRGYIVTPANKIYGNIILVHKHSVWFELDHNKKVIEVQRQYVRSFKDPIAYAAQILASC